MDEIKYLGGEHWIDKDPVVEKYFENLLNKIIQYVEVESKNPKNIIKLTEDDIIEPAEEDIYELLGLRGRL